MAATATLLCLLGLLAWFQTRAVVVSIRNDGNSSLTNVVVLVTGKTYRIGDVPAALQKRVTIWPAADQKITVDYHDGRAELDTSFLASWSAVGPMSRTVTSVSAVQIGLRRPCSFDDR